MERLKLIRFEFYRAASAYTADAALKFFLNTYLFVLHFYLNDVIILIYTFERRKLSC